MYRYGVFIGRILLTMIFGPIGIGILAVSLEYKEFGFAMIKIGGVIAFLSASVLWMLGAIIMFLELIEPFYTESISEKNIRQWVKRASLWAPQRYQHSFEALEGDIIEKCNEMRNSSIPEWRIRTYFAWQLHIGIFHLLWSLLLISNLFEVISKRFKIISSNRKDPDE